MENIWGFILQTMSVSIVAALLLIVKGILHDKLSPMWQYGVWTLLALRILIPASLSRGLLHQPSIWLETAKASVERSLGSAYSFTYMPITVKWPIPFVCAAPQSVTDWLFIIYAAGVLFTLLWYFISYIRLRLALRRRTPAADETQRRVDAVCSEYGLRGCRVAAISGLPSAFICGIIRPVLAVPEEKPLDDKVILHELLHLKYKDSLQSVAWCILRALHWCNPFLQVVFNRIAGDMEALCDQRVLERLEGEARREYGTILLDMANDRYPRAPGTTSLSNGGKNIARRIAAIARFKRYPRGMALVSVCIVFVLAVPAVAGFSSEYDMRYYQPSGTMEFEQAMSLTRIRRCTTVAGALDTYAKGLMLKSGIYIATASPLYKQEELAAQMRYNAQAEGWVNYHLDVGAALTYLDRSFEYQILNLKKQSEDCYEAYLLFSVNAFLNADGIGWLSDENGETYTRGCVLIPVMVTFEDSWVVEEPGERRLFPGIEATNFAYRTDTIPAHEYYQATGDSGTVTVQIMTRNIISNTVQSGTWSMFGGASFDETIKLDAVFSDCYIHRSVEYRCSDSALRRELKTVGMEIVALEAVGQDVVFPNKTAAGEMSWSSNNGTGGASRPVDADWDGILTSGSGGTIAFQDNQAVLPVGYVVRILWDGVPVEDFVLEEVSR